MKKLRPSFKHRILFLGYILLFFSLSTAWRVEAAESGRDLPPDLTQLGIEELMKIEVATVYGASKYEQKVTEAPSSVSIITSEDIKRYGYRTLADLLRSVKGFFITYDRNYSFVGVRGFGRPGDYNTRTLVLVDGHRFNDNIYDGALIGTEFILDMDLIDRVEVIRGPSSSLYGTNAFLGVINVITKRGRDLQGPEVSGETGSFRTYRGRISYGHQFQNDLEVLLSGSFYDSHGQKSLYYKEFDAPGTNNGLAENVDGDRSNSFFSKFSFYNFSLEGAHVSREKVIPTASYNTVYNDARNRTTDEQSYLNLKYENHFGSQLGVMARVYYNRYFYHGDYLYDQVGSGDPVDFVLNKDFSWGSWWGAEVQLTKKVLEKYQFVIGAEYTDNLRQDQENYDEAPYFQYLDDKRNSQIWALYLQGEIPILNNLKLNAGVRYDHYDTFGDTTNPRLALIYNPLEKTFIKLLYGTAFRAPNVYEFYYQDGGNTSKSNPRLQPEKIETYELVWEQYLGNSWRLVTSGYYYKIKDLISQETDPQDGLLIYNNIEEIQARGVELGLEGKWGKFLEGRISYSFQETENRLTRNSLTNSPNHLAKLNLTAPLIPGKVFVGLEEQYTSQRKTLAGNEADSFFVTNLTLFSRNLLKGLEASVSVYNLFDNKYSDPGAAEHTQDLLQQDGRSCRFKLTYKF